MKVDGRLYLFNFFFPFFLFLFFFFFRHSILALVALVIFRIMEVNARKKPYFPFMFLSCFTSFTWFFTFTSDGKAKINLGFFSFCHLVSESRSNSSQVVYSGEGFRYWRNKYEKGNRKKGKKGQEGTLMMTPFLLFLLNFCLQGKSDINSLKQWSKYRLRVSINSSW